MPTIERAQIIEDPPLEIKGRFIPLVGKSPSTIAAFQNTSRPSNIARPEAKSALKRLLSTFFNNSPADLVATLLDPKEVDGSELARIKALIDKRKK